MPGMESTSGRPAATPAAPPALTDPGLLINRELAWLDFNERVLLQATGTSHPPLERVKFLSIVATNLEEFFMIRVASLLRKSRAGLDDVSPDGLTTSAVLKVIRRRATDMLRRQDGCWNDILRPLLREHGIRLLDPVEYTPAIVDYLQTYFVRQIAPALTPLAFDPGHPFPFISNLSQNLAVVVKHAGKTRFARVKIPDVLPRFMPLPVSLAREEARTFVYLEDVIRANLGALFPGTQVKGAHLFRVVRDADLVIQEDEADDLLESIDQGLKESRRGAIAMLQVEATTPRRVLEILIENFEIEDDVVYRTRDRIGYGDWSELASLPRPELKYPPFAPSDVWQGEQGEEIFADIRHRDRFVHLPFQSFSTVEAFLAAAVNDPHVIAIKMTLYRIGTDSPLVDLLVEAAEAGKQVAVLVELKARFDERNNIKWATRLEAAGAHVAYGLLNLKTHAKACLVVRKEADGIRRYAHLGTGNYNAQTARAYTDLGLFTTHADIVEDVSDLFNYLTGYSNRRDYRELLVAPLSLRARIVALVEHEIAEAQAGREGRIIIKINALTDVEMIRLLYRASQAGVAIDLIVRGICCLRPGVPGVSETIAVRSIVGRFLEHSRIFWFHNGGAPRAFIGSADLMERNLDRRVEVLCPIHDLEIADHLRHVVLATLLRDVTRAHVLKPNGTYVPAESVETDQPSVDAQDLLLEWYTAEHQAATDTAM
jgi:polyphosphate kinase